MILLKMLNLVDLQMFGEEPYVPEDINPKTPGQLFESPLTLKVTLLFKTPIQTLSELKLKFQKNTLFPQKWLLGHNPSITMPKFSLQSEKRPLSFKYMYNITGHWHDK